MQIRKLDWFAFRNVIITIIAVAILGVGVNAFAHMSIGWDGGCVIIGRHLGFLT